MLGILFKYQLIMFNNRKRIIKMVERPFPFLILG